MNLMLMTEVTFWHYWLFLLLQGIQNPVKRVIDNDDKLSDLPDCVLLHILSFLNTKYAVQTCVLSKRWKNLWKRLPSLRIGYSHFKDLRCFEYFVHGFLGRRDRSTALQVLDFMGTESHIERFVNSTLLRSYLILCRTLTSLQISVASPQRTLFPKSFNFPALTILSLLSFDFRVGYDGNVELFSAFKRLKNLIFEIVKFMVIETCAYRVPHLSI